MLLAKDVCVLADIWLLFILPFRVPVLCLFCSILDLVAHVRLPAGTLHLIRLSVFLIHLPASVAAEGQMAHLPGFPPPFWKASQAPVFGLILTSLLQPFGEWPSKWKSALSHSLTHFTFQINEVLIFEKFRSLGLGFFFLTLSITE